MLATDRHAFRAIVLVVRVFAVFAIVTGLLDVIAGPMLLSTLGSRLTVENFSDQVLNSQLRYLGAMWAGIGALFWWTTGSPRERTPVFYILLVTLLAGAAGRVLGAIRFGMSAPILWIFLIVEVVGTATLFVWHNRLLETATSLRPQAAHFPMK